MAITHPVSIEVLKIPTFSLLGKKAFITGGSRGIGRACALALAGAGADVALSSSSTGVDCARVVCEEIRELGRRAEAYSLDVAARGEVALVCNSVKDDFEQIDILINNAGVTRDAALSKDGTKCLGRSH